MKLNKRYIRNIRENLSFYISATVLTMVSLLLYFLFSIAGQAILDFSVDFYAEHGREDAHFTAYMPISEEQQSELAKKYNLNIEAQSYINLETDGTTARIFKATKQIDTYAVTEGRDIRNDDEIVISEGYAVNMSVAIGDSIKIGAKNYRVVGYMQRPDYLYMLKNENDSYKNVSTFFLCIMTDNAFEALGEASVEYLVQYNDENTITDFRRSVYEDYYMSSYYAAEENPRITMVEEQAHLFLIMAYVILCILPLIAVVLVSIIIGRKVKDEQRMIGALAAMGYKKRQIMVHYAGFAAISGLVGGVLAAAIALAAAQPFSEAGLQDYEPMRVVGRLNPWAAVLGIAVPTLMYILAGLLSVGRLLGNDTVKLLSGTVGNEKKHMKRVFVGRKMSFRTKFAFRSMLGNPVRSLVVLMGVFLGSFIMLLGMGCFDSMRNITAAAADEMGRLEYQYILNDLQQKNTYGGEALLMTSAESDSGVMLSLLGTDSGDSYLNLNCTDGTKAVLENGYYITSLTAIHTGWAAGDAVTLCNPLSMEKTKITIAGVIDNNIQKSIYTSRANAAAFMGIESDYFNAVISDARLDIPEELIAQESKSSDINDQVDAMLDQMGFMFWIIIILGVVICVAAVYVAVNMVVTENRTNISMLKVLGYKDEKINRIVLQLHHILLPIGIVLSIPVVYLALNFFFSLLIEYGLMQISGYIALSSYLIAIGFTVLSYFGSLWLLRRKVQKVSMVEILKASE